MIFFPFFWVGFRSFSFFWSCLSNKERTYQPVVSIEDFYTYAAKPRYGQDHENPRVKWLGHRSILVNVISQLMGVITMAVMNVPPTASRVATFFFGWPPSA